MYIVVCVATLTSRVKGFHVYKNQVDIGTKIHCELEPENSLFCKKAINHHRNKGHSYSWSSCS